MDRIKQFWKQANNDLDMGHDDTVHFGAGITAFIILVVYNFFFIAVGIIAFIADGKFSAVYGRAFLVDIVLFLIFALLIPYVIGGKKEE